MTSASPPSSTPDAPRVDSAAAPTRTRLAVTLQEALTTVARLRANKQVATDAEAFRVRIKQVLATAEQEARASGYAADDVRFALFAVIAFLDETVLNSGQPMFAHWPSRTLQEEVFGVHMAGELFFQYLQQLMARQDSPDLADILEVYSLCAAARLQGPIQPHARRRHPGPHPTAEREDGPHSRPGRRAVAALAPVARRHRQANATAGFHVCSLPRRRRWSSQADYSCTTRCRSTRAPPT